MRQHTEPAATAYQYAETIAAELDQWRDALAGDPAARAAIADEIGHEPEDWYQYLDVIALAVEHWHNHNTGETITEVLRTYGGPSCRIVRDSRDRDGRVSVVAYWWNDPVGTVDKYLPELADVLAECAEISNDQRGGGR
jgi:hypothetical protein